MAAFGEKNNEYQQLVFSVPLCQTVILTVKSPSGSILGHFTPFYSTVILSTNIHTQGSSTVLHTQTCRQCSQYTKQVHGLFETLDRKPRSGFMSHSLSLCTYCDGRYRTGVTRCTLKLPLFGSTLGLSLTLGSNS